MRVFPELWRMTRGLPVFLTVLCFGSTQRSPWTMSQVRLRSSLGRAPVSISDHSSTRTGRRAPRNKPHHSSNVIRKQAKSLRESVLATQYGLICTLVLPHPSTGEPLSGKAKALADFCVEQGLTNEGILEEMFCHFSEDTYVTLHVGAERAANPREQRECPGWDSANDLNGDGRVDDDEAVRLAKPKATARRPSQARIPIYFWGPPRDDFVMNVGHPAYQEFMATVWSPQICERHDGIYFDTVLTERIVNSRCTTRRETHPETSCSNRRAVPCRRAFGGQLCSGSLRSPPQSRPPNQGNACPKASPYSKPFLV